MFNVALKQQAGNSVSKWVASSRRSLISFRVSRHRITNTSTGMQSSTKRLIRFSRESISRESHSEAFSHSQVHLRKRRRHWHGRMLDTSNRKRSPQGAEQRKSARFQPVATAMTVHLNQRTSPSRDVGLRPASRPTLDSPFLPRTRGSARPCRRVRRCWCGERYRPWQPKTITQSRMLLTEVAYQRCAQ
jgi:hypothetical protein